MSYELTIYIVRTIRTLNDFFHWIDNYLRANLWIARLSLNSAVLSNEKIIKIAYLQRYLIDTLAKNKSRYQ